MEHLLSELYAVWMDTAEEELADITGTDLPKRGCRSQGPKLAWRSILPETSRKPPPSGAAALAWLADISRDATRLARPPSDSDSLDADELLEVLRTALEETIDGKDELDSDGSLATMRDLLVEARRLSDSTGGRRDEQWATWAARNEEFLEQLRSRHAARASGEASERLKGWREWIREGVEAGARHAHAYLRLPAEWRPSTSTTPQGLPTADPAAILEGQRDKYAKAWADDGDSGWYQCAKREALPRLSPEDLREASRLFKRNTAVAYDGVHVRHYALLSEGALEALGGLLEVCELVGTFPRQARLVVTPLLEKPKGGYRPIAVYVSVYRLWTKARRNVAAAWEEAHPRSFFSAARGNGPLDTTWRQGVRQETQVAGGGAAACLYWDLESFFECVDRIKLLQRAEASGFPMPIIRLAMAMYAAPRVLSMGGRIAREVWPKRGVGAGCGLANTFVKIFTLAPLDELLPKLPPSITLDLHVDDFAIESVAQDERTAARDLIVAQELIRNMVQKELGAVVSVPKAALVASSCSLATVIRDSVGTLAGPVKLATPNLGIDATAARRRAARGAGPLRRERWGKAFRRRHRLRALASVIGPKAGRIFTVGIGASATYHAAVQGISDSELIKLRRLAAVAYPPRSRFRSLTVTHLLHGMPTAAAEVAATMQFSRAVWSATLLCGDPPRHDGFDLPGLRAAWEKVAEDIGVYIDAEHPDPKRRRVWGKSRGPLSAAMLELHRIGWQPVGPFEWTTDLGHSVLLTETPPALLKVLLKDAVRRQAERLYGDKMAARDPRFAGRRYCIDAAANALMRDRTLTSFQKGAFRSVLLGGVLTRSRAVELGYDIDDECELCGHKGDSIFHRTYRCSGSEAIVKQAVPEWFWREMQDADEKDTFWVSAAVPHPADLVPPPRPDYLSWAFDEQGHRCEDPRMEGHVFIDGSCSTSVFKGLQRAALALVQLNDGAKPTKTVSVPLWSSLPQTSQAAEHAAYAGLSHVLDGRAIAYGDCQGVLDLAAKCPAERYSGRKKYAGILRSMLKFPQGMAHIADTKKVKAHQHVASITDDHERWLAVGNDLADKAAKAARERHPAPPKELADLIRFWEIRAPLVVRAVATAMVQFSPLGGKLRKRADTNVPAPRPATVAQPDVHKWEFTAGRWRCSRCWTYVLGDGGVPACRRREVCQPGRVPVRQLEFQQRGHVMMHTDGDLPITFCARCGGWSSRRANRLGKKCGPPTAAGRMALRRIEAGLHPWQARDAATGKVLPRTRLSVKRVRGDNRTNDTSTPAASGGCTASDMLSGAPPQVLNAGEVKRRRLLEAPLAADPAPPYIVPPPITSEGDADADAASEEDVFGHGGSLDQGQEMLVQDVCKRRKLEDADGSADTWRHVDQDLVGHEYDHEAGALEGASMPMLLKTLSYTPRHYTEAHIVPVFNSSTGCIVRASLRHIEMEVRRLREQGVRDEDPEEDAAAAARSRPQRAVWSSCPSVAMTPMPTTDGTTTGGTRFTCRADLIRHLQARGTKRSTSPELSCTVDQPVPMPSSAALSRKGSKEPSYVVDNNIARAISTHTSAVDARVGLGGPVLLAGATAAAALPSAAEVAAAVTARSTVAQLRSGTLATLGPPDGCAAPSDGNGSARYSRPDHTTPQARPTRLGRGRASKGALSLQDSVGGPPTVKARRMGGVDEPHADASAARSSADAAGPSGGKKPLKGCHPSVPTARNEFVNKSENGMSDVDEDEQAANTGSAPLHSLGGGHGRTGAHAASTASCDGGQRLEASNGVPGTCAAEAASDDACDREGREGADSESGECGAELLLPPGHLPPQDRERDRHGRRPGQGFPHELRLRRRPRECARGDQGPRGQVHRAAQRAEGPHHPGAAGGARGGGGTEGDMRRGPPAGPPEPKRPRVNYLATLANGSFPTVKADADDSEDDALRHPERSSAECTSYNSPLTSLEGELPHMHGAAVPCGAVATNEEVAMRPHVQGNRAGDRATGAVHAGSSVGAAPGVRSGELHSSGGVRRRLRGKTKNTPFAEVGDGQGLHRGGCHGAPAACLQPQVDGEMNTQKYTFIVRGVGQAAAGAAPSAHAGSSAGRPVSQTCPES